MLFNSIDFAIFLPIVFLLYWFVANKNLKVQNFLFTLKKNIISPVKENLRLIIIK